ncbi:hypothetical protein H1235_05260 [Pseudoxanthomonas sp. NC8]|nr:hypothetical protein H1235_05260 [Pseudoxanthomonas sp. NC8]
MVVPAVAVSWLTWRTASANALESSHAALRTEIKHYALTLFERLDSAHAMLRQVDADDGTTAVDGALLEPFFSRIERLPLPLDDAGGAGLGGLLARQAGHRGPSATLVVLPAGAPEQDPQVVLLGRRRGAGATIFLPASSVRVSCGVTATIRPSMAGSVSTPGPTSCAAMAAWPTAIGPQRRSATNGSCSLNLPSVPGHGA